MSPRRRRIWAGARLLTVGRKFRGLPLCVVPTNHLRYLQGVSNVPPDLLAAIDEIVSWRDRLNRRRPA
jgi:hypothetical protein